MPHWSTGEPPSPSADHPVADPQPRNLGSPPSGRSNAHVPGWFSSLEQLKCTGKSSNLKFICWGCWCKKNWHVNLSAKLFHLISLCFCWNCTVFWALRDWFLGAGPRGWPSDFASAAWDVVITCNYHTPSKLMSPPRSPLRTPGLGLLSLSLLTTFGFWDPSLGLFFITSAGSWEWDWETETNPKSIRHLPPFTVQGSISSTFFKAPDKERFSWPVPGSHGKWFPEKGKGTSEHHRVCHSWFSLIEHETVHDFSQCTRDQGTYFRLCQIPCRPSECPWTQHHPTDRQWGLLQCRTMWSSSTNDPGLTWMISPSLLRCNQKKGCNMDARNCDLIWTGSGWRLPDEATRNALVVASKNDEDTMFKCLQLPYWDLLIEIAQIYPCSPFLKAHFPPVTRDAASWVCQQFKNGNAPPIDTLCFVLTF